MNLSSSGLTRRQVLALIGKTAGAAVMFQAMSSMGFAAESSYDDKFALRGAPKGKKILVLGAGVAGMLAALELRKAGYSVKVLEYNAKAGGRCWTIRGGDVYTELGGEVQKCEFDRGHYINPGPWRIPYHHRGILDYCKKLGVALEPFVQVNYNAYVHSSKAFGGKPQRFRHVQSDFQGHIAEMLSKAVRQGALNQEMNKDDTEKVLQALQQWGALDKKSGKYIKSLDAAYRGRGFKTDPGGGLMPHEEADEPLNRQALIASSLWRSIIAGQEYEYQSSIFQPTGGMDMIAKAFEREVGDLIRYQAKVTRIQQNEKGVTVSYVNAAKPDTTLNETADYCVCTLPLSILSQIPINVSDKMAEAIAAVPYQASFKIGMQFKRRFWEEDEQIYGGITYTDTPVSRISYPSAVADYFKSGKGVLLGAYIWGPNAYEFTSLTPAQRIEKALEYGSMIHPQYRKEFENAVSVGWHRVPWTNGCYGIWSDEARAAHYHNLCQIDNRIVLAGEHASYIPAWLEGAVLSAQDATKRLHAHIVARG